MLAMGSLAARPWRYWSEINAQWPDAEKMGRVTLGMVNIRVKPYQNAEVSKVIYDDAVVPWLREVVSEAPDGYGPARWVETPDGYIYAPRLQPVWNKINTAVTQLPEEAGGKGMWAEVTVPYVDVDLRRAASSAWIREKLDAGQPIRLYYSMVVWVDDLERKADGSVYYRINERYGNPGDTYWVPAEAMRPLTEEEISPIRPDATEKKVVVNLTRQTLSCYEGRREVYFCRISSGAKFDSEGNAVDAWATPVGLHPIYRKLVSLHMSGPKTGDWPAVAWTAIFATGGVAIHSTYWHNYFGIPRSHGCVNCAPDDAKFVWRWSFPHVGREPGDIDVSAQWPPVGTTVDVVE
jgi:lipoprotein-anchoring transpeptidase ErfK/SrfK